MKVIKNQTVNMVYLWMEKSWQKVILFSKAMPQIFHRTFMF